MFEDGSVVTTPLPCPITEPGFGALMPLHLDLDETMDVIGFGEASEYCIMAGLGVGDGSFVWESVVQEVWPDIGVLPGFQRGVAIDPELDGIDALAVLENSQVGLYSNFLPDVSMPEWSPIAAVMNNVNLAVGQLDDSPESELLVAESDCSAHIRPAPDFVVSQVLEADASLSENCRWQLGWFGGATQQPISVVRESGLIELWSGSPFVSAGLDVIGMLESPTILESGVADDPRLVVINDGNGWTDVLLLWGWANFPDVCMVPVDVPFGTFAAGDLDGDGVDELAVITPWPDLELHVYSFGS
jgi:hypothetical protein